MECTKAVLNESSFSMCLTKIIEASLETANEFLLSTLTKFLIYLNIESSDLTQFNSYMQHSNDFCYEMIAFTRHFIQMNPDHSVSKLLLSTLNSILESKCFDDLLYVRARLVHMIVKPNNNNFSKEINCDPISEFEEIIPHRRDYGCMDGKCSLDDDNQNSEELDMFKQTLDKIVNETRILNDIYDKNNDKLNLSVFSDEILYVQHSFQQFNRPEQQNSE